MKRIFEIAGFHVSIVRLYQAKDSTNTAAEPLKYYPTSDSQTPIGMTDEVFSIFNKFRGR